MMTAAVIHAQADLWWRSPICWALAVGALSVWVLMTWRSTLPHIVGLLLGAVSLIGLGVSLPAFGGWLDEAVFWLLAAVTLLSAAAAIIERSPVYTAIWFALSLLGTAGLFLFQGAQFLGVATVVVYAGAIVVTFLFVLMLAQPEGHARYDRISWAWFSVPLAIFAAAAAIGIIVLSLDSLPDVARPAAEGEVSISAAEQHMARFGSEMFARHLISVEVAGTLLLVSLVGAIAIVIQGRPRHRASGSLPGTPHDLPAAARAGRREGGTDS